MEHQIDPSGLDEFIGRQVELIETEFPNLLADVELSLRHEATSRNEVTALGLGAGPTTHVGRAILEEPEGFITTVADPAPLAA